MPIPEAPPETLGAQDIAHRPSRRLQPVASYAHTLGLLGIFLAVFAITFALQGRVDPNAAPASAAADAPRRILPGLIESLLFDWLILYYVWGGVRRRGSSLLALSGRSWASLRDVLRDVAIALPFWMVWEAVAFGANSLLAALSKPGAASAPGSDIFPVRGLLEISVWLLVSISAGFCEELIFRGYLQRQFGAITGSVWAGILMQAIVFGLIHPRGWRAVVVIAILGVLYGTLAALRNNLRPTMLAHAFSDIWEGWLKFPLHFNY